METINAVVSTVQHNGFAVAGVAYGLGLASANVPLIVKTFVCWAPVSKWIRSHPAIAESIVTELKKDVDQIATPEKTS